MRRSKLVPTLEGCPVGTTLTVIGGKWKGILLKDLRTQHTEEKPE